jgi:hypothetical protein
MGALIPTQYDNEICDNLNKRFSTDPDPADTQGRSYIEHLRALFAANNFFDNTHHLHRVAHLLAVSVTGGASVPASKKHRLRWFHLLHKLLPPQTDQAIRDVLTEVLKNPNGNIAYAKFFARPAPIGLKFEVYPQNSGQPYLTRDANGNTYCQVFLDCKDDTELPDPRPGEEHDPPDTDPNEQVIPGPKKKHKKGAKKGAKKSAKKVTKSPAKKSAAKKKRYSARKSAPKKKKSSSKKTPAKKAKKGRSRR